MRRQSQLDRILQDIADRQRNLLPADPRRRRFAGDWFLWKLDSKERPGLIFFAFLFLALGIGIFMIPFLLGVDAGNAVAWLIAPGPLFLSYKLFRGAVRRPADPRSGGPR